MLLCKEYKKQSESIINRISTNKLYNPTREFPGSWEIGYNLHSFNQNRVNEVSIILTACEVP